MNNYPCYICNTPNVNPRTIDSNKRLFEVKCPLCGLFRFIEPVYKVLIKGETGEGLQQEKKNILSIVLRHSYEFGSPITITFDNIHDLIEDFNPPKDPIKRVDKLLLYLYNKVNKPSDTIEIDKNIAPIVYSESFDDLMYYLGLAKELGLIKYPHNSAVRLSINGWSYVNKLLEREIKSDQAFVAMSFSKDKLIIWKDGIKPTLELLGYNPVRIDEKEHNDMIIDHIIGEIRKSGLVIADFTDHKHGVYFEAGFAMGLGVPVIWTCHENDINGIHFDTKPFNHISWTTPEELGTKLKIRIEATIPNRPKPRTEDSSLRSE